MRRARTPTLQSSRTRPLLPPCLQAELEPSFARHQETRRPEKSWKSRQIIKYLTFFCLFSPLCTQTHRWRCSLCFQLGFPCWLWVNATYSSCSGCMAGCAHFPRDISDWSSWWGSITMKPCDRDPHYNEEEYKMKTVWRMRRKNNSSRSQLLSSSPRIRIFAPENSTQYMHPRLRPWHAWNTLLLSPLNPDIASRSHFHLPCASLSPV